MIVAAERPAVNRLAAHPFFLEAPSGRLFAVHHRPAAGTAVRGHVLCVPPFNEEMNRCRSMLTLQAQAFAKIGIGTLVVDLHGTGDSEGDYSDARWAIWLDDLKAAFAWLSAQDGGCRALLGIRLGAILAAQLCRDAFADRSLPMILWQPVVDGKTHLTQFLRVRMAAQLDRADLPKETTATMRRQLASGQTLEVAGYEIHPELADAIDAVQLSSYPPAGQPVLWLENETSSVNTSEAAEPVQLSIPSKSLLKAWEEAGVRVTAQTFAGPAFWQVHERVVAPNAITRGTEWLDSVVAR